MLKRYAAEGTQDAFAELVQRYCNLVWASAYRVLGDGDPARDAAMVGGSGWQHHSLHQLRAENAALEQLLAESNARPSPSARETAGNEEIERLRGEHAELLQLRGEYAMLLKKPAPSAGVERLKNELAAARAQAATNQMIIDTEKWRAENFRNVGAIKQWRLAMRRFASLQGNQQLPTAFSQMQPYFTQIGVDAKLAASQGFFEFVNQGRPLSLQDSDLIVMRELAPTLGPNGEWARVYLLADASAQYQVTPDGNFSAWEQPHMAAPGSGTPPDAAAQNASAPRGCRLPERLLKKHLGRFCAIP